MFKFSFTLDYNDYFEFNKYHLLNNSKNRRAITILRLLIPCMFAFFIGLTMRRGDITREYVIFVVLVWIALSALWIMSIKPLFSITMKYNLKHSKNVNNQIFNTAITLIFEKNSVTRITAESETTTKYKTLQRIGETKNSVYIYINDTKAILIPKSAFASGTEKQQFIDFVHGKITAAR